MNIAQAFYATLAGLARGYRSSGRQPYSGAELREIRKRKGVGRPPKG
jgi:hypothetical protein